MAYAQCLTKAAEKLQDTAPGSFSHEFTFSKAGENNYTVVSYLDTENSNGAVLRRTMTCKIRRTSQMNESGDPKSWTVVDIKIEP